MIQKKYSFIVADDHSVVRQGVSYVIKELYQGSCVVQADSFSEIIELLTKDEYELLVLDVNFPDGSSLAILPAIKKAQPNIKILIFSAYDEDIYAIRYINAGANGYLNKLCSAEEMKLAISTVMNSGKYTSQNIKDRIIDSYILKTPTNPLEQLSNREIEIAKLMVEGLGNLEICAMLNLRKSTVSTYKNRIFEKLGVDNLLELFQLFNLYNDNPK